MATLTLPAALPTSDDPVRIVVVVVHDDMAESINVAGPVCSAVRSAFAHPRLAEPLETLRMDADRMIGRILSRWNSPGADRERHQMWEKSNGSTTVHWCVERRPPKLTRSSRS
jgi:hypothetical protein